MSNDSSLPFTGKNSSKCKDTCLSIIANTSESIIEDTFPIVNLRLIIFKHFSHDLY